MFRPSLHVLLLIVTLAGALPLAGCNQSSEVTEAKESEKQRKSEILPIPTPPDIVDKMLEMARVTADDLVVDLGCGDGRIVIAAAKRFGCKAVGYDIEPDLVRKSQEAAEAVGVADLVTILERDIFTVDLSDATVVTIYLLPHVNLQLVPQLELLKPGSRIVSHDFGIQGYKPDEVVRMESTEDGSPHTIYLWTAPLRKEAEGEPK